MILSYLFPIILNSYELVTILVIVIPKIDIFYPLKLINDYPVG